MQFVSEMRKRIKEESHCITSPRIILTGKHGQPQVYRPIAVYDDLADRVLLSLTARYLRDCFDEDLVDNLYSFRRSGKVSHHSAVRDLESYRQQKGQSGLYVAECDIKAFFDTVSHAVVEESFRSAFDKAAARGREPDPRAAAVLDAYLASYSFYGTAVLAATEQFAKHDQPGKIACLPVSELKRLGHKSAEPLIGIPQGGALSPLIANLVLSSVDEAILGVPDADKLFYARFCDDILLAHPSKNACDHALRRCLDAMIDSKIPAHKPVRLARYGKEFYSAKSKHAYLWDAPRGRKSVVPWVSFVGYQLRYDGKLRIRRQSIENEQHKQKRIVGEVLRVLTNTEMPECHLSGDRILSRTRGRLTAMAIGRKDLRRLPESSWQPCWADAFYLLDTNTFVGNQMRTLDHGRERELRRLKRSLARLGMTGSDEPDEELGYTPFYWGAPYSYYGYFFNSQEGPVHFAPSSSRDYTR
jgi:hypothetical protein